MGALSDAELRDLFDREVWAMTKIQERVDAERTGIEEIDRFLTFLVSRFKDSYRETFCAGAACAMAYAAEAPSS